ncbi:MAG: hypothetical protein M3Q66_11825, partial [Chloroflexota bacterium]|nr:hypothetical protein [Chloroflexota bacterium]
LAADPSAAPGKPDKAKVEKAATTVTGQVSTATDAEGKPTYTLRSGSTTYVLDAGPAWFFGANHPLKPYVGTSVTVVGEKAVDSNEVEVTSVDGKALRAAGKPPWAGGWKVVGERHPGWTQEKAARFKAKFGDCFPPGTCKDKPNKPAATTAP